MAQSINLLVFSMIAVCLIFIQETHAQDEANVFTAKNSIYVELAGNSALYGVNFGRILFKKSSFKLAVSAGFSLIPRNGAEPIYPNFWSPVFAGEASGFWGKSNHHLEIGAGVFTLQERDYIFDPNFPPTNLRERIYRDTSLNMRIGYRYQKPDGGFFFRAGYTPRIDFNNSVVAERPIIFVPFGVGISLGKSF